MKPIDRLIEFQQSLKDELGGQNKFEAFAGISNGYLSRMKKQRGDIGSDVINKISDRFPQLSIEWLFTGKGEMFKSQVSGGDIKNIRGKVSGNIMNTAGNNIVNIPNFGGKKIIKGDGEIELQNSAQSLETWEIERNSLNQRIADLENMVNMKDEIISTLKENISLLKKMTPST